MSLRSPIPGFVLENNFVRQYYAKGLHTTHQFCDFQSPNFVLGSPVQAKLSEKCNICVLSLRTQRYSKENLLGDNFCGKILSACVKNAKSNLEASLIRIKTNNSMKKSFHLQDEYDSIELPYDCESLIHLSADSNRKKSLIQFLQLGFSKLCMRFLFIAVCIP